MNLKEAMEYIAVICTNTQIEKGVDYQGLSETLDDYAFRCSITMSLCPCGHKLDPVGEYTKDHRIHGVYRCDVCDRMWKQTGSLHLVKTDEMIFDGAFPF